MLTKSVSALNFVTKRGEANSASNIKSTGLQKWLQRLHKERILENWCKENLRVFQAGFHGAFQFIKRKNRKNIHSSARLVWMYWKK